MSALCAAAALVLGIVLLAAKKPWDILAAIGSPTKIKHYAAIWEWQAGAVNAGLLIALALASRWWFRQSPPPKSPWLPAASTPRWFWPLVVAAMAITAFCGLQRISQSIWDDEDSSVRRVILGEYRLDKNGEPVLREATWEDALWNYRKPSNHHLQTILSKASLVVWRALARPTGLQFTEPVLRWPILAAAILSIAALAALLKRLDFPRAAVLAAFLLALHPWHIRYAIEIRGYLFTLLFGPLMVYCLIQAIASGRWRWWMAFAASEFGLLYAYPGTLYMLLAANGCGLIALWFRHDAAERFVFVPRLFVASAAAGMVYAQLMAPCLPQLVDYFKTERALGALSPRWHANMGAHLLSGIPWNNSDDASAGYPELRWITGDHAWISALLVVLPALLAAAGLLRLAAKRPAGWLAAVVLILPAIIVYGMSRRNNHYLYEWYVIFILPGLCSCAALALEWPARWLERTPAAAPAWLAIVAAAFAAFTEPARHWMLSHPLQPMREAVQAIRPSLDPGDPRQKDIMTVSVSVHLESYDARVLSAENVAALTGLSRQADREKKSLYVVTGNDLAVAQDYPEIRNFVHDARYFERVAQLPGFDPTLTQYIWRYKPGTLSTAAP